MGFCKQVYIYLFTIVHCLGCTLLQKTLWFTLRWPAATCLVLLLHRLPHPRKPGSHSVHGFRDPETACWDPGLWGCDCPQLPVFITQHRSFVRVVFSFFFGGGRLRLTVQAYSLRAVIIGLMSALERWRYNDDVLKDVTPPPNVQPLPVLELGWIHNKKQSLEPSLKGLHHRPFFLLHITIWSNILKCSPT